MKLFAPPDGASVSEMQQKTANINVKKLPV
jgi:hypothetical protein